MINKTYVEMDDSGTYRVGGTRMTLDVLLRQYFLDGTAESVAQAFPSLGLENIYGALAFYLANREEMDAYLKRREKEAAKLRAEIEAIPNPAWDRLRDIKRERQGRP